MKHATLIKTANDWTLDIDMERPNGDHYYFHFGTEAAAREWASARNIIIEKREV